MNQRTKSQALGFARVQLPELPEVSAELPSSQEMEANDIVFQYPTAAETRFKIELERQAKTLGIILPLKRQKLHLFHYDRKNVAPAIRAQLNERDVKGFGFRISDFYLPFDSIVIEIDGRAHDRIEARSIQDETREAAYLLHVITLFVYRNEQVFDDVKRGQLIAQLLRFIQEKRANEAERRRNYNRTKKAASRARKAFLKKHPFIDLDHYSRKLIGHRS